MILFGNFLNIHPLILRWLSVFHRSHESNFPVINKFKTSFIYSFSTINNPNYSFAIIFLWRTCCTRYLVQKVFSLTAFKYTRSEWLKCNCSFSRHIKSIQELDSCLSLWTIFLCGYLCHSHITEGCYTMVFMISHSFINFLI